MNLFRRAPRAIALLLSITLFLPQPAWALRTEAADSDEVLSGLEEAFKESSRPDWKRVHVEIVGALRRHPGGRLTREELAARAGVSVGALYNHNFRSLVAAENGQRAGMNPPRPAIEMQEGPGSPPLSEQTLAVRREEGQRLRRLRTRLGLSQDGFSLRLSEPRFHADDPVSRQWVSLWEKGKRPIPDEMKVLLPRLEASAAGLEEAEATDRRIDELLASVDPARAGPYPLPREEALEQLALFEASRGQNPYLEGRMLDFRGKLAKGVEEVWFVSDLHAQWSHLADALRDPGNLEKLRQGKAILILLGDAEHPELVEDRPLTKEDMESSIATVQWILDLMARYPRGIFYSLGNHSILWRHYREALEGRYGAEYVKRYEDTLLRNAPVGVVGDGFAAFHGRPPENLTGTPEQILGRIKGISYETLLDPNDYRTFSLLWSSLAEEEPSSASRKAKQFLEAVGQPNGILVGGHLHRVDLEKSPDRYRPFYLIYSGANVRGGRYLVYRLSDRSVEYRTPVSAKEGTLQENPAAGLEETELARHIGRMSRLLDARDWAAAGAEAAEFGSPMGEFFQKDFLMEEPRALEELLKAVQQLQALPPGERPQDPEAQKMLRLWQAEAIALLAMTRRLPEETARAFLEDRSSLEGDLWFVLDNLWWMLAEGEREQELVSPEVSELQTWLKAFYLLTYTTPQDRFGSEDLAQHSAIENPILSLQAFLPESDPAHPPGPAPSLLRESYLRTVGEIAEIPTWLKVDFLMRRPEAVRSLAAGFRQFVARVMDRAGWLQVSEDLAAEAQGEYLLVQSDRAGYPWKPTFSSTGLEELPGSDRLRAYSHTTPEKWAAVLEKRLGRTLEPAEALSARRLLERMQEIRENYGRGSVVERLNEFWKQGGFPELCISTTQQADEALREMGIPHMPLLKRTVPGSQLDPAGLYAPLDKRVRDLWWDSSENSTPVHWFTVFSFLGVPFLLELSGDQFVLAPGEPERVVVQGVILLPADELTEADWPYVGDPAFLDRDQRGELSQLLNKDEHLLHLLTDPVAPPTTRLDRAGLEEGFSRSAISGLAGGGQITLYLDDLLENQEFHPIGQIMEWHRDHSDWKYGLLPGQRKELVRWMVYYVETKGVPPSRKEDLEAFFREVSRDDSEWMTTRTWAVRGMASTPRTLEDWARLREVMEQLWRELETWEDPSYLNMETLARKDLVRVALWTAYRPEMAQWLSSAPVQAWLETPEGKAWLEFAKKGPQEDLSQDGPSEEEGFSAGLEERMPDWLRAVMPAQRFSAEVSALRAGASVAQRPVAVLFQADLIPGSSDVDRQVLLAGLEESVRSALAWPREVPLRLDLATEGERLAQAGFRTIEVLRHPEGRQTALPESALPLVAAEALAHPRPRLYVDPLIYAGLEEVTLPEVLATLTDLFA